MNNIKRLRKGRLWHKKMQEEWMREVGKDFDIGNSEKYLIKGNKRPGRVDFHLENDEMILILEFKYSDWDRMKSNNHVKKNIKRYIRQLWNYLESESIDPEKTPHKKIVQISLIFPKKPKNLERLEIIEDECDIMWISVVWNDEDFKSIKNINFIS